jgi:hypothetical protein
MTTTAPVRTTHPCPVEGCDRPRVAAQNMCSFHWASIPATYILDVLETWDVIEKAWPRYIEARNAALRQVPGSETIADQVDREALAQLAALAHTEG